MTPSGWHRDGFGQTNDAAVRVAGEHGASDRLALSGASRRKPTLRQIVDAIYLGKAAGGVFPQGRKHARRSQRRALVIAEPMGQSGHGQEAAVEYHVCAEPAGDEGVSAEGKPGSALDLPLRRRHDPIRENWIDQLRWQRLKPFEKLAQMLWLIWKAFSTIVEPKHPWAWWKR